MSDKVLIHDFSGLYICPSKDVDTLGKRAIEDAVYLRDIGGTPFFYCLKDSAVYFEAVQNGLDVIPYSKKRILRNFDLAYLNDLRTLLKENHFDFIHCYGLRYIWNICLLLFRNQKKGVFLTLNKVYAKSIHNIFFKILINRVDTVFCFGPQIKEMIVDSLPVHQASLKIMGAGVNLKSFENVSNKSENETFKIGTIISSTLDDCSSLLTFINAIDPLLSYDHRLKDKKIEVVLISDQPWKVIKINKELVELLHERAIDYKVRLIDRSSARVGLSELDVFISTTREPFNLLEVYAMLSNIPLLIPRKGYTDTALEGQSRVYETYHFQDSRELRVKCYKIIDRYSEYMGSYAKIRSKLLKTHSNEEYFSSLSFYYEKVFSQRSKLS